VSLFWNHDNSSNTQEAGPTIYLFPCG
jgi:hypothetical protein